jgi:hypothetical protein
MRIWSIHPKYLDIKGLLAVWREGLLAQKVLMNRTKGYKNHTQLIRFKCEPNPIAAIGTCLMQIYEESKRRGYHFDKTKIIESDFKNKILVTSGQVKFEWEHFKSKVRIRNPMIYNQIININHPILNPIFIEVNGKIEQWEKTSSQ